MKICISICATKSYCYALKAQARRVVATLDIPNLEGLILLVGDGCDELKSVAKFYSEILPSNFQVKTLYSDKLEDGLENYKAPAQLVVARMRSLAFSEARRVGFDMCWSLDSDVLPPYNALRCMIQMLEFDDGFYGVVCCPYPSQGGGDFLGGRGSEQNPILPDCYEDERLIPQELESKIEKLRKDLLTCSNWKPEDEGYKEKKEDLEKVRKELAEAVQQCPPKGDVFFLNSHTGVAPFVKRIKDQICKPMNALGDVIVANEIIKLIENEEKKWKALGFRRRGWISAAYPGIGLGCVVPVEWFGFGCNLMNKKALSLAQFEGYEGGGTEDLYVIRKKWMRNGIRLGVITHCPADHVIRDKDKPGEFTLLQCYHETQNQECVGHLRYEKRQWFQQVDGEKAKEEAKEVIASPI